MKDQNNCSFTLGSGMHRIGLRYHPKEDKWTVINPGSELDGALAYKKDLRGKPLSMPETIHQNLRFSHGEIAKVVSGSLAFTENVAFNIIACTRGNND